MLHHYAYWQLLLSSGAFHCISSFNIVCFYMESLFTFNFVSFVDLKILFPVGSYVILCMGKNVCTTVLFTYLKPTHILT